MNIEELSREEMNAVVRNAIAARDRHEELLKRAETEKAQLRRQIEHLYATVEDLEDALRLAEPRRMEKPTPPYHWLGAAAERKVRGRTV